MILMCGEILGLWYVIWLAGTRARKLKEDIYTLHTTDIALSIVLQPAVAYHYGKTCTDVP